VKSTPGPDCSICDHPERASVEDCLAAGVSIRDIARQLGQGAPSFHAIQRHKQNCMRDAVLAAREADAIVLVEEGRTIVERCREVNREAWALLNEAKSEQDRKVYASLLGQALKSLELEAKLLGELGPTNQVLTQVNVNAPRREPPQWLREIMASTDEVHARAVELVYWAGGERATLGECLETHEQAAELVRDVLERGK
jgi:hypothetical protein